ncbi:uncharacterized protein GIQ15_03990 [Arthroderma uncinatum]|uniref:uncharacterized protein n=1 Tax=Arthroderma uncinatum TaxID=74035 RepID=UPI00144AF207|nr:uncharacterized protein GIQ15_03990 [Arthroderma uncinatum]KAF3481231.1 hypothetical protein GIQ15_03990 [Arthroderma uncinatum]
MESPTRKFPQHGGSPLHPLSPRRINQQIMSRASPVPSDLAYLQNKSDRQSIDVQSKVAFLNRLASPNSPAPLPPSTTTHAALQRAILGREEAEDALKATTEELNEARQRERRVSERLESLLEEIHTFKERQSQERAVFEKEIRRARKEAFRASSNLVKAQEELKSSRGEIKSLKDEVKSEREAKDKAKQDAFERAYALAGLTEENEVLKEQIRAIETDNQSEILEARAEVMRGETPKTRLQRSSMNPMSCSPASRGKKRDQPDSRDQMSPIRKKSVQQQIDFRSSLRSPTKLTPSRALVPFEEEEPLALVENEKEIIQELEEDLRWEKLMRRRAEDMIDFLKLECQFKRCSCRIAERQGVKYIHDLEWEKMCPSTDQEMKRVQKIPSPLPVREASPQLQITQSSTTPKSVHEDTPDDAPASEKLPAEPTVVFCPDTGTFKAIPSPARKAESTHSEQPNNERPPPTFQEIHPKQGRSPQDDPIPVPKSVAPKKRGQPLPPAAPLEHSYTLPPPNVEINPRKRYETPLPLDQRQRQNSATAEIQTITTTKTVPIHSERPSTTGASAKLPGTPISREEALAQIRARRGRTQSALKRSASANDASHRPHAMGGATTPNNGARSVSRAESYVSRTKPSRRGLSASGSHGY